jgi:3',5'-nucleoside bisphosphate phosphatase
MIRAFRCDLHIHTCLSPCAELDMYPRALIDKCIAEGLDVIAITDHNASENIPFVRRCAEGKSLTVLSGMEITSSEEVHILALFDNYTDLLKIQKLIYENLPGENKEEVFGCQAIVNDLDEVEGFNGRLLIGSTRLSLSDIIAEIHSRGGLAIAAHIDRESFSVISQLGFIDPDMPFDALEISHFTGLTEGRRRFPKLDNYAFIESSDAHYLKDIGSAATMISMKEPTIAELKKAFAGCEGRMIQE